MVQMPTEMMSLVKPVVKVLQIITLALAMGAFLFGVIVIGVAGTHGLHTGPKMLILMAAGTGMFLYLLSFPLSAAFANRVNASDPPDEADVRKIMAGLQTSHIIKSAMIEGGVYLNLIVLLLDHGLFNLWVAGLGIVLLVLQFPTLGRFVGRVEKGLND